MVPVSQSESSTQAKAGSEVRQRTVTAIRLRIVVSLLDLSKIAERNKITPQQRHNLVPN
jgi:hypothetical protein